MFCNPNAGLISYFGRRLQLWQEIAAALGAVLAVATMSIAQMGHDVTPQNPSPGHARVYFAMGRRDVPCKSYRLKVTMSGRMLVQGEFSSEFQLPAEATKLAPEDLLDVQAECGGHTWNFGRVPGSALSWGSWRIGTAWPPFQPEFTGPKFAKCRTIQYLDVYPVGELGWGIFKSVPRTLANSHQACTGD